MQIDRYSSDPDDPKRHERSAKGVVVTLLFLFLIGLFVIWRIEGDRLDRIQAAIIGTFVPVIESGQQPGEFFAGITAAITRFTRYSQAYESLELVQNNLAEWQKRAQALELENAALKKIVNFIEVHKTAVLTVPVIADTSSPFTNSLLVNAGSENGVQVGWMATDGVGVVGHVTSVGPVISRIILIQDTTSRIPAKLPDGGVRVLAVGTNSSLLELVALEGQGTISAGERVVTSGDAGVFIPNYLIGTVILADDGEIRLRPAASFSTLRHLSLIRNSLPQTDTLRPAIVGDQISVPIP